MIVVKKIYLLLTIILFIPYCYGQAFTIARIHYNGGGDWYGDPSSLPNLLEYIAENTSIIVEPNEYQIKLTTPDLNNHSFLYMTGHGNIRFTEDEITILRNYLIKGGFLHADDNYGMDDSFRREIKRVFPSKEWVELPHDHSIFNSYFSLPNGLPKIHEHENKRPQALGIFHNEKLIVLYTFESDLGDGWEDPEVHKDPEDLRIQALKMGTNIITYYLTQ